MLVPVVVEYYSKGMNILRAPLSAVLFVFGYVGATDVWAVGCHGRGYLKKVFPCLYVMDICVSAVLQPDTSYIIPISNMSSNSKLTKSL
jgi:hypothetical protein